MLVTPLPGARVPDLIRALEHQHTQLSNIRGSGGSTQAQYDNYVQWVAFTDQALRNHIRGSDLDTLLLTRRQWALQTYPPGPYPQGDTALRYLLTTEVDQLIVNFADTIAQLKAQERRFDEPGRLLVADTSFFIRHPAKLADTVIADDLDERETPLHLMVPIVVVDELDGLKQSKDRHVRWRAGHTLGVLDAALRSGSGRGELRPADWTGVDAGAIPRGRVTVEILFDPPGHHRLPINDDEIIDRALAVQTLAGRRVTLITYDTGHATRARAAGLDVRKLTTPVDDPDAAA